jgi:peptide/nickel transport system substrate-binding protein
MKPAGQGSEAGADSGLKKLYLVPESGSGMIAPKSIGTVMQAMLQDVGVEVEVQTLEWNAYLNEFLSKGMDRPDSGKPQLSLVQMSWMSPVSDPGLYINYYLRSTGPYNSGYYNNPQMDQLLDAAMATVNQDERKSSYSQAQILAANEAPWIFMFHAYNVVATQNNITNFTLNPNMNNMKFNTVKVG